MTSDLLQHAKDCDVVVRRLKKSGYTKIFAVGHSFGGLSLLQARTSEFQALSFWDISSFISYPPQSWYRKDPEGGSTYLLGGYELMLSKRYRDGIDHFPNELGLISKIKVPTQICYANGPERFLVESSARYFEHLSSEKELVAVPAASHSFTEEGVGEFLFKRTHKWFKRWN